MAFIAVSCDILACSSFIKVSAYSSPLFLASETTSFKSTITSFTLLTPLSTFAVPSSMPVPTWITPSAKSLNPALTSPENILTIALPNKENPSILAIILSLIDVPMVF